MVWFGVQRYAKFCTNHKVIKIWPRFPLRSHIILYFCAIMRYICALLFALALVGCTKTDDEKAAPLLARIQQLYGSGKYRETLDSIESLRLKYPKAIEARKEALHIWQSASLSMAQEDVARTDVLLQETIRQMNAATDHLTANRLRLRRDSLETRYEAMCGVVKMIRARQKKD